MKNILIKIEYKGTNYSGWQIQSNATTVQQVVQNVFQKISQCATPVKACSRTDAGVHAREQIATVFIPKQLHLFKLIRSVNSLLPGDIAVNDMVEVSPEYSVRKAAKRKRYVFQIHKSPIKNVFNDETHFWIKSELDLDSAFTAIQYFLGTHDFSAFRGKGCQQPNPVKTISFVDIATQSVATSKKIYFIIEGSGFLKNMVRIMSGTLLDIAKGRLKADTVIKALETGRRDDAGVTAPAKGLVLDRVYLDPDPFQTRLKSIWLEKK